LGARWVGNLSQAAGTRDVQRAAIGGGENGDPLARIGLDDSRNQSGKIGKKAKIFLKKRLKNPCKY